MTRKPCSTRLRWQSQWHSSPLPPGQRLSVKRIFFLWPWPCVFRGRRIADDAGNASRNPALIMMFDRPTFSAEQFFVDPGVDISGRSRTGADSKSDNIAPTAWVPNMHFVAPINDQFGWGASVTSNYGLATEFNNDYAAGAFGGKTDLRNPEPEPERCLRLDNHWSFGALALTLCMLKRRSTLRGATWAKSSLAQAHFHQAWHSVWLVPSR